MPMNELTIVDQMVRRIADRCSPRRIILFGSHARGEAGNDSDVDLLVLFEDVPDPRRLATELYEAVLGMELPKDMVAATLSDFERYKSVANTVHQAAAHHGIVVYESES
jgi:predicted nucleotidyltransferase